MTARIPPRRAQRGFLLIEGLVAILIFSLGILGMIAMAGTAVSAQSDAHFRTDAARLADDITNTIALSVDRTSAATIAGTLTAFQHQPTSDPLLPCNFSGAASTSAQVLSWLTEVQTVGPGLPGLPGTSAATQQIAVVTTAAGNFNRVQVTVCWRAPGTPAGTQMRRHTVVTYIN